MRTLLNDLRLAIRGLARSPLIVLTAVATLALGIASTTAVFSIVNAALFQPLRYGNPDRLVLVWEARRAKPGYGNPPAEVYVAWRDRAKSFEQLAALANVSFDLRGDPAVRIGGVEATANFFSAAEVQPALGRVFTEDEARGGARVLVLGHELWKNRFAADPNILGKTVVLSGASWTVIGVMPEGFSFIRNHDLWVPMELSADRLEGHNAIMPVAKLRRGVTFAQADAELDAIQQQIIHEMPDVAASRFDSARVMPLRNILVNPNARSMLMLLLGAVGLVLLIACANVANLLLARGTSRQKEIAVRISLGATRVRIVRLLLAEAAVLAMLGAAAGLALAFWAVHFLASLPVLQKPGAPPASIDLVVLAFVAGVTMLTLMMAGMLPAWQTSGVAPVETLKAGSSAMLGAAHHRTMRSALVVAEVALSVVLLANAGLLVRRLVDLLHVNPGFDPAGLLTMDITRGTDTSAEAARNFYDEVLARTQALPGVESAAVSTTLPMVGWQYGVPFRHPDQTPETKMHQFGMLNVVSANYFETLRLPIVRGRAINAADTAGSQPVVVIDSHLAKRYFKDEDPIGKTLLVGGPFDYKAEVAREVVGVAADVRDSGLENPIADDVYLPFEQYPVAWEFLSVRSSGDPSVLTGSVRAAIATVDQDQPLEDISTMQERVDDSLSSSRFTTRLLGAFAALSLLLAAIGIYGVIAYNTAQRTAELGLRTALGARPAELLRLVMASGMKLVLTGGAIGIAAAVGSTRLLTSVVAEVNQRDPLVYVAALVVIVAAALCAMLLPARRAAKIDPMTALRHE
jgi:putative ABC transport system permease protein